MDFQFGKPQRKDGGLHSTQNMITDRTKLENLIRKGLRTLAKDIHRRGKRMKRARILNRLQTIYRDVENMSRANDEFEMKVVTAAFNSGRKKLVPLSKKRSGGSGAKFVQFESQKD